MLISISEYATIHNKSRKTVQQMAQRGGFKTARKIGRNWCVDDKEPYPDHRVKGGKYKGFRKKT